ncbi:hypothetical protein Syncc8109_2304 [Synechococcus sp. WH 8109]|nr:hypothetical protein Syncc8109_2304 [Synechococcus sp. WH 8109]
MSNKDRGFYGALENAGCNGWIYFEQQQKLFHFKLDSANTNVQCVVIRMYRQVPTRPPRPMARRLILRQNAIVAWLAMRLKGLWRLPTTKLLTQYIEPTAGSDDRFAMWLRRRPFIGYSSNE